MRNEAASVSNVIGNILAEQIQDAGRERLSPSPKRTIFIVLEVADMQAYKRFSGSRHTNSEHWHRVGQSERNELLHAYGHLQMSRPAAAGRISSSFDRYVEF